MYLLLCLVYPSVCDSQKGHQRQLQPSFPHNEMEASKLEQEYVHQVYEEIARHFSSTRHSPWPRIVEFLKSLPKGSIVADVGCGNGKYLGINEDLYMVSSSYCHLFFFGTSVYFIVQLQHVGASVVERVPRTESCCLIQGQLPIVLGFHIHSLCTLPFSFFKATFALQVKIW